MAQKEMTGKEFIKKILAGERDFSGVYLSEVDLGESRKLFEELKRYLKVCYAVGGVCDRNPIVFNNSTFSRVNGKYNEMHKFGTDEGLNLAHVEARNAKFYDVDFSFASFGNADFRGADFANVNFNGAYLGYADFRGACFERGYYCVPTMTGQVEGYTAAARFYDAILEGTDLRGVKGLDKIENLEFAIFNETKVTPREKAIIDKIMSRTKRFIVTEE